MAGLPPSPAFGDPELNAIPGLSTPAVPPGAVDEAIVGREARRYSRVYNLVETTTAVGIQLILDRDLGLIEIRKAQAVSQAAGGAVAPPWFAPAITAALAANLPPMITAALRPVNYRLDVLSDRMDVLSAHVANYPITRHNTVVSPMFDIFNGQITNIFVISRFCRVWICS